MKSYSIYESLQCPDISQAFAFRTMDEL